ncbi:MAG TPA: RNA-protein complex protein Nop10 [Methanomicrobia archaeon]|nr:RNA-protein complex protein Nop10 [Methanomicrobia archaeon]
MKLRKCIECGRYTLHDPCPRCGAKTQFARPPKYSPKDKYARYRRMWKKECSEK